MKKIFLSSIFLLSFLAVEAHLPKWVIEPLNDSIAIKVHEEVLQGEAGGKTYLWDFDGKELFSTNERILPFRNGVAVIQSKGSSRMVGAVDTKGNFISLPELQIAYVHPYYEDDLLISAEKEGHSFYDRQGNRIEFPQHVRAYPFHGGYSSYFMYENPEKAKDGHYTYFRADRMPVNFNIMNNGKVKKLEATEIDFLSSLSPDGKGVAIIKNRFYWFNPETQTFEPILRGDEESEKKRHLSVAGDFSQYLQHLPEDSVRLTAKYGKNNMATLWFDKELVPVRFQFDDGELDFSAPAPAPHPYTSKLSRYGEGPEGLSLNKEKVLPEQFEDISLLYDNKAIVKLDGKWGVIEIVPDADYSLKLNKGEDVAFRHQKFETQLRLDLPSFISAKNARIDIDESTGLELDRTSRESKDTESGSFVTYNTVLTIPPSLPDTISTITYFPVKISYDGIKLFETPLDIKAWHLKYYNVDPIESETSISNGVASITLNINAQRIIGEGDYPFDVKIDGEALDIDFEKLSETRYKCTISNLAEGNNNLNIIVTEKGCPPSVFPFDVYYTKPKSKKEEVVVRKKTPAEAKVPAKIEL